MRGETDATDPFEEFLKGKDADRELAVYRRLDVLMDKDRRLKPDTTARINGHTLYEVPWMKSQVIGEVLYDYDALERMIAAKEVGELPLAGPIPLAPAPYRRACEYCKHSEFFFDGVNIVAT